MNESNVRREVKRIEASINRAYDAWVKRLDDEPEVLLGPMVEKLLHALRGWDKSAADGFSWMLGC